MWSVNHPPTTLSLSLLSLSLSQSVDCNKDPAVCTPVRCSIANFGIRSVTFTVTSVVDNRYFRVSHSRDILYLWSQYTCICSGTRNYIQWNVRIMDTLGTAFCPLFRGCPFFRGRHVWTIYAGANSVSNYLRFHCNNPNHFPQTSILSIVQRLSLLQR